jgi:ribosomal protein L35AE/L33A
MDFLMKKERVVLETKMARKGLDAKTLGEELLIDISRYGAHQDCETLICFVYDPSGWVRNPAAIEGDLTRTHGHLNVRVLIRPRQ